ncbi:MAG: 3-phosphoshikimate 1-carboxyvinyltransferase [Culturomica sp.]|jgi:3-phosphoshikimate 1-carboxyvinyltransferase|nr:3-phosphoshikimate 1-carboxyvinyltransferase [Culturomica sp.]
MQSNTPNNIHYVSLPLSKSVLNRVAIIKALCGDFDSFTHSDSCEDINNLVSALQKSMQPHSDKNKKCVINVGNSGTAMRFLTANLSMKEGEYVLTGSKRIKERPVLPLVEALRELGATIEYAEHEGFFPLHITGKQLEGGNVKIRSDVSSQFVSALLLIAPYMKNGLKLQLSGSPVSEPYISMTIELMKRYGISVKQHAMQIEIKSSHYINTDLYIEADWTAASYFYELLSISKNGEINISGLLLNSIQGDAMQVQLWEKLGVSSKSTDAGVVLFKNNSQTKKLEYNFIQMPDLVQTFAVACCLKGIIFSFSGVSTLRTKETDRIHALITELGKLGFQLTYSNDSISWQGERSPIKSTTIETHGDHRMAMAFAPAKILIPDLKITNPKVVEKSFPDFWNQLNACII